MLKLAAESHARVCALVTRLCGSLLCRSRCRRGAGCCSAQLLWPLGHSPGTWARFSLPVQHLRGETKGTEWNLQKPARWARVRKELLKSWQLGSTGVSEPSALPAQSPCLVRSIFYSALRTGVPLCGGTISDAVCCPSLAACSHHWAEHAAPAGVLAQGLGWFVSGQETKRCQEVGDMERNAVKERL